MAYEFVAGHQPRYSNRRRGSVIRSRAANIADARWEDGRTGFQDIKVLTDTPADQLNQSMHVIKAAVGLDYEDCHVDGDFPADAKRPKLIARQMMQMVMDLNKSSFKGQPEITCYTCHRGNPDPVSMPTLPIVEASREANVALPTVDQILAKYVEALGGDNALRKVTSRVITGTQYLPTGPGGVVPTPATIERDLKAPNLVVNIYRTPTYTISTASMAQRNGHRTCRDALSMPDELTRSAPNGPRTSMNR